MNEIPQVNEEQARRVCEYLGLEAEIHQGHYGTENTLGLYKQGKLVWFGTEHYSDRCSLVKVVQAFLDRHFLIPMHPPLTSDQQAQIRAICGDKEKP